MKKLNIILLILVLLNLSCETKTKTKAVVNGESTYDGIRDSAIGAGWWQGHEAWLQVTSGGSMGVVYGAGGL